MSKSRGQKIIEPQNRTNPENDKNYQNNNIAKTTKKLTKMSKFAKILGVKIFLNFNCI